MISGVFLKMWSAKRGGNVWESNPAIRREADANGFEDREGHQCPIRPQTPSFLLC